MTDDHSHIVPYQTFVIVWCALLVLTGITVWVAQYNLGAWNVWVALTIATFKSGLVVAYFMHMKYEQWLFKLSLLSALAILAIFIGFTFFDVLYR
ncbi:MAG: cytochrome C oxidase subunit IV family protein [Deltaproteobacteria bacterium]|jgi:cytochrome c oxidase subunit 4|nr:cytochrome C oxidase subunit IV family protein [Deltaproteobacteria bacterium]